MNRALQIRLDRGLSRTQVCEGAGITQKALRNAESDGESSSFAATLKALGDYYEVPASTLVLPAVEAAA
jgi:transcriptional regulator with XRE-family HTH domain